MRYLPPPPAQAISATLHRRRNDRAYSSGVHPVSMAWPRTGTRCAAQSAVASGAQKLEHTAASRPCHLKRASIRTRDAASSSHPPTGVSWLRNSCVFSSTSSADRSST